MAKLIIPNSEYLESYKEAFEEYQLNSISTYSFTEPTEDIFTKYDNYRKTTNLQPGIVPSNYYWLVDNGKFIGEISIRHFLTDKLNQYGGHIGYGIRCSMQKEGYGSLMLKLALKQAKELKIKKVLITCNDDNYGSSKVIENNGGVLENKVENIIDDKKLLTRRYWIDLD